MTRTTQRFILLALRNRWRPAGWQEARWLVEQGRVDWESFRRLAAEHAIAPLLYRLLRDVPNLCPPETRAWLRQSYARNGACNTLRYHALGRILEAFSDAGISTIVLKGIVLAVNVYRDIALRPMVDVDILVRPGDLAKAVGLLAELGYVPQDRPPLRQSLYLQFDHALRLGKTSTIPLKVELHWRVESPFGHGRYLADDWAWQCAVPATIADCPTHVLSPEAMLLHLAVHLARHYGEDVYRWIWPCDLAELLARTTIDWNVVRRQARESNLDLPLHFALSQCATLLAPPGLPEVLRRMGRPRPDLRQAMLFSWSLRPEPRSFVAKVIRALMLVDGIAPRMRFAWANAFPDAAYMKWRYDIHHSRLLPLYYIYRWGEAAQDLIGVLVAIHLLIFP